MGRRIGAVVAGLVCGLAVIVLLQLVSSAIYPPPDGLDFEDADAMKAWMKTLPAGAFAIVLVSHAMGAFCAALVCQKVVGARWPAGWIGLGVFFLVAGLMNLVSIPHPGWFKIADPLLYLPAAWLGAQFVSRKAPVEG